MQNQFRLARLAAKPYPIDNIKFRLAEKFRGLGAGCRQGEKGEPFSTIGKRNALRIPLPRSLIYDPLSGREDSSNLRKNRYHLSGGRGMGDAVSRNRQRIAPPTPAANPVRVPGRERGGGVTRSV